jgi:hypothetical protein
MNLTAISQRALGTSKMLMKQHGPAVLTGVGVIGFGVTTVLVAKAAVKAKPLIDKANDEHQMLMGQEIDEKYTKQEQAKDIGKLWIDHGGEILKIYGPAIAVGTLSVVSIVAAHGMMRKQQTALLAAYAALDTGFRAYRRRIEEEVGPERELELFRGVRRVEALDDEGKPCVIEQFSPDFASPYAIFFDETNPNWTKTAEYNKTFLMSQQDYANDRLRAYGFLFLNEVLESLGFDRTQAGQVVGWKLKKDGGVDGFVDFGIFNIADDISRAFVNGLERSVLLDFNVDGPIRI